MKKMNELEKIGIHVLDKIKVEYKNQLAKTIANKLSSSIPQLSSNYNELYMRIFNCDMYFANINKEFGGVFYFYKNNSIYIDKNKDIENPDEYIINEVIHYIQNFEKVNKKINRAGICNFTEFKIVGMGLNEAVVQYISATAHNNNKIENIQNEKISFWTNSKNHYKYMTSLINQIVLLLGQDELIKSTIQSTEDFENKLYNTFEEKTNKILKNFDIIFEENNKKNRNENKIINKYIMTQEIIYKTYFTKVYNNVTTIKEVDLEVEKLTKYQEILGVLLNNDNVLKEFERFKSNMERKFLDKYIEINRLNCKKALIAHKKTVFTKLNKVMISIKNKIMNVSK